MLLTFSVDSYATENRSHAMQGQYCALPQLEMLPLGKRPVYSVKSYGAKGDGLSDDTGALQKAFDDVPSGAVLEFPPGTYLHRKSLTLSKDGTILMGKGGILKATNPDDQTILLTGRKSAVIGMILHGTGDSRSSQPQTTKIWVRGRWNQILNNEIKAGASAGIFVFGAKDFSIVGNLVSETLADGIHMTNGSQRGLVEHNIVHHTGDDPIAVVSYKNNNKLSGNIIIRNNSVSNISHGRGITVVGGEHVLIEGNSVSDITGAAGILIAQEKSYKTGTVNNIIVRHNHIQNIQMPFKLRYPHHGAIDLNSSGQSPVENIQIQDNTIEKSRFAAVRILGEVCNVEIIKNKMMRILDKNSINVIKSSCAPEKILCTENTLDGKVYSPNKIFCAVLDRSKNFINTTFVSSDNIVWLKCKDSK